MIIYLSFFISTCELILQTGCNHVAVGLIDLGILLACELKSGSECSGISAGSTQEFTFYGYERNPHSVAKSRVIWQIACTPSAAHASKDIDAADSLYCDPARAVLQIWFSSTWSVSCSLVFHDAVASLLVDRTQKLDKQVYIKKIIRRS